MSDSVLLVASDRTLRDRVESAFRDAGWDTRYTADAAAAALVLTQLRTDLAVILGGSDPEIVATVRALRAATPAPILVAAPGLDAETCQAVIDAGAETCSDLPDAERVIVSQADAVLRRHGRPVPLDPGVLSYGGLTVDPRSRTVEVANGQVRLTRTEFDLLALLMANPERVVSRNELLTRVWGTWFGDDHTVEVHLSRLRRKILDAGGPRVAESFPGVGYRFGQR